MAANSLTHSSQLGAVADRRFGRLSRRWDAKLGRTLVTLHPGDYYVATDGELIGTLLGSCVSACIRDRRLRIGGMNHFMLPKARAGGGWSSAAGAPTRFGLVAMERLINDILKLDGRRSDLEIKLVGGGQVLEAMTDIGAKNIRFVREFVQTEGYRLVGEDLGGLYPRKVLYDPVTGHARVKTLRRGERSHIVADEVRYSRDIEQAPLGGEIELF